MYILLCTEYGTAAPPYLASGGLANRYIIIPILIAPNTGRSARKRPFK